MVVRGYARSGFNGLRVDQDTGPAGPFILYPSTNADRPVNVTLEEPGWTDLGRSVCTKRPTRGTPAIDGVRA